VAVAALVVGHGTGGATQNLTVANNIIDAPVAVSLGGQRPGMKMGFNLYTTNARFQTSAGLVGVDVFKEATGDVSSIAADTRLTPEFEPEGPAVDKGTNVGLPFCGGAPDIGAVETGC
jgi:hypothetical protein